MAADRQPHADRSPASPRKRREVQVERGQQPRALRGIDIDSRRVVIEHVQPSVDGGRFPAKRVAGDRVVVTAGIFGDGHDVIVAVLKSAALSTSPQVFLETPMALVAPGTDAWTAAFTVDIIGWHEFSIVAWIDRFLSWRRDLDIKAGAGQDVSLELLEGALLLRETAGHHQAAGDLLRAADALNDATPIEHRIAAGLDESLAALMAAHGDRTLVTESETYRIWVDRERARFSSWYEMFPRSAGPDPARSATFQEAATRLPEIADLGFDVLYLPPIHPIGRSFRKGRNNSLAAAPGDPGSPWAIGSHEGGHTAIEPGLGTFDDFEAFRAEAERLGLEIALDLAWQCSPDHPWVRQHPEWFRHRPDGTIRYAENPPKKYQDIYPLDFGGDDWRSLWKELLDVTRFWIERGVRIFRVDNPHTKTFRFWEWLIDQVHADHPEVIFLSEAFTRPKIMRYLAKAGFSQSYTYFTWRNSKDELTEYFTELAGPEMREYFRANLFANTPDILHAYLQHGGRPAFEARLLLAATLGANYGLYSGFELCEGRAVPGTEEYADSEKYQIRQWDWNRPGHIKELIRRVNTIRRSEPALQSDWTLRFHHTDNPSIVAYSKSALSHAGGMILAVVNLDPFRMQHGFVDLEADVLGPSTALRVGPGGAGGHGAIVAHDLLDDVIYEWTPGRNYVRLEPGVRQGHLMKIGRIEN